MRELIPDILDELPGLGIEVTYEEGKVADFGNVMTPFQIRNAPQVKWHAEHESYYTLVVIDPDAPKAKYPTLREYNHWLVVNINGSDLRSGDVKIEYTGPLPYRRSGLHRIVFLLYKQIEKSAIDYPKSKRYSRKNRAFFNTRKFAIIWGLGQPVAGNYIRTEWEEPYVDDELLLITDY